MVSCKKEYSMVAAHGMRRFPETTADGSTTFRVAAWDEPYHSTHGAIQESRHVFIQMGLRKSVQNPVRILEIGFGTGLNALLSLMEARDGQKEIFYTAIEAFPLSMEEVGQLNYLEQLQAPAYAEAFANMHSAPWETESPISPFFVLKKLRCDILEFSSDASYDLVYFDAFGANVQPELWTPDVFAGMYRALNPQGILVTYAAKGSVRRAMLAAGFQVERLPGPPGKREMLRALKPA